MTQEVSTTTTMGTEVRAKSRPMLSAFHSYWFREDLPKVRPSWPLGLSFLMPEVL